MTPPHLRVAVKTGAWLAGGILAALLAGEGLRCVADRLDMGPAVQVHPVIRAWDASARGDR